MSLEENDRSIGAIVRELMESISTLMRSEIDLVKLEIRQSVARLGSGGGMFATAAVLGLFAVGFLLATLAFLLARMMPAWGATLVVAVLLLIIAGVLVMVGRAKVRAAGTGARAAIETMKSDLEAIRSDLDRRRGTER